MRNQKVCRQKPKLTSFGNSELEAKIRETFKARLGAKRKTVEMYALTLARFCKSENVEPFDFETLGLETIEDKCENFIRQNQDRLSPKYLNVIFNAVKSWCFCTKLIKSRKLFREIKFDKSSRKFDAINEVSLETSHIKQMIQTSDMDTKILVGLYAFAGLRPALIPQLTVGDFAVNDYTLQNGKIEFQNKNPFLYVNKNYEGNKAHITFFVILHSKITELLETALNSNSEPVTAKTPLMRKYNSSDAIYQKIVSLFASVGFVGRPYLLRSFADKVLDRNLASGEKRDEDLKEFMLGHKGKISAVYQLKALSTEDAVQYRKMYDNVDKWICENIFGTATTEGLVRAKAQSELALKFGADPTQTKQLVDALTVGEMTIEQYDRDLTKAIEQAQTKSLEAKFEMLFSKYVAAHTDATAKPEQPVLVVG
jgi:integrase